MGGKMNLNDLRKNAYSAESEKDNQTQNPNTAVSKNDEKTDVQKNLITGRTQKKAVSQQLEKFC